MSKSLFPLKKGQFSSFCCDEANWQRFFLPRLFFSLHTCATLTFNTSKNCLNTRVPTHTPVLAVQSHTFTSKTDNLRISLKCNAVLKFHKNVLHLWWIKTISFDSSGFGNVGLIALWKCDVTFPALVHLYSPYKVKGTPLIYVLSYLLQAIFISPES